MVVLKRSELARLMSVLGLGVLTFVQPCQAQDSDSEAIQACAQAYEQAQVNRNNGELRAAQQQLGVCVRDVCPDFVRSDCGQWLSEVNTEIPSVIFAAVGSDGSDLVDVKVSLDDEVLVEKLDGRAIELDPGQHEFVFSYEGKRITQTLVVRQGEKNRLVRVEIVTAADSDSDGILDPNDSCPHQAGSVEYGGCNAPPPAKRTRSGADPFLISAIAFWGAGAVGMGSFAWFGLEKKRLEKKALEECQASPCDDERREGYIDDVESRVRLANISVVVGGGLLAVGTGLFVVSYLQGQKPRGAVGGREKSGRVKWSVLTSRRGAMVSVGGKF